jgi:hypothetical protein
MNERIRELLKQVRTQKHTENLMSNPPKIKYSYTIREEDLEKFAELIVRECAKLVEDNMDSQNAWITPGFIKQHFGVEE